MFGWKLIHKRELNFYAAQMEDYRNEIARLHSEVDLHRDRSEKMVNILLAKKTGMAMKLDKPLTKQQEHEFNEGIFDIFNEGNQITEQEALEKLQNER